VDIKEEVKKEEEKKETPKPETPPTDFKIAEIWIKSGHLFIEAPESFWTDRCRALGVLEYCKDIVKEAKMQSPEKKIITPGNGNFKNFVNRLKRRK